MRYIRDTSLSQQQSELKYSLYNQLQYDDEFIIPILKSIIRDNEQLEEK